MKKTWEKIEAWVRARGAPNADILKKRHKGDVFRHATAILASGGLELHEDSQATSWFVRCDRFPVDVVAYASPFFDGRHGIDFALGDSVKPNAEGQLHSVESAPYEFTADPEEDAQVYARKVQAYVDRVSQEHADRFASRKKKDADNLFSIMDAEADAWGALIPWDGPKA